MLRVTPSTRVLPLAFALWGVGASGPAAAGIEPPAAVAVPEPAPASDDDPMERAAALVRERRLVEAIEGVQTLRAGGGLTPAQLAETWRLEGRALGALGQGGAAERAFAIALRIEPEARMPLDAEGPEVAHPYQAALAALPAARRALWAHARLEEEAEGVALHHRLAADDLGLVAGAALVSGSLSLAISPSRDGARTLLPPAIASGRFVLLDPAGNALWERDLRARQPAAPDPTTRLIAHRGPRLGALLGGSLAAVGAVGVFGTGIAMALASPEVARDPRARAAYGAGALAGTALIALGAVWVGWDLAQTPPD